MEDYVYVNKYHVQGIINKTFIYDDHTRRLNYISNYFIHAQHQKYIGNHSQTIIPIKNLGNKFHSPIKNLTRRPAQFKSYAYGT